MKICLTYEIMDQGLLTRVSSYLLINVVLQFIFNFDNDIYTKHWINNQMHYMYL